MKWVSEANIFYLMHAANTESQNFTSWCCGQDHNRYTQLGRHRSNKGTYTFGLIWNDKNKGKWLLFFVVFIITMFLHGLLWFPHLTAGCPSSCWPSPFIQVWVLKQECNSYTLCGVGLRFSFADSKVISLIMTGALKKLFPATLWPADCYHKHN